MLIKPTKNGKFKITDLSADNLVLISNFFSFCDTNKTQMGSEYELIQQFSREFYRIKKEYAC